MSNPMHGLSTDARRDLPLAAVAAATTWLTMLSWRGFSDLWGQFLGPLIVVAIAVPVAGSLLRAAPIPRRVGALIHLLVIALLVWLMLGGSPIHPFSSTHDMADRIGNAWISAETYRPPIPQTVPGIAPLLIPCGALALLVVDMLACWLRRVPLAGLPLLAVYCVPISVIGDGVPWLIFLFAACGFLLMIFLQESAHITRWGRPLGSTGPADPQGFGVRNGASKASATSVGSAAVVLAVVLPVFIPTLHLDGLGLFGPGGNGSGIKVINPITDMRRNLHEGANVPLLTVKTDDPDPSYLRIAALAQYNGLEWSTGSRSIRPGQTATGQLPLVEQGLSGTATLDPHAYKIFATTAFDSHWLPTPFPATSVTATGDWHWDATTMDFLASNDSTNTAGLTYTAVSADPQLSSYSMINSLTAPLSIQEPYTATPDLPPYVEALAQRVTKGATSRFQQAVMLQDWFRTGGGFRYSLKTSDEGDSNQALMDFLTPGKGHRVGYCEQFSSAYAVMARSIGLPTRVAIGFINPKPTGPNTYVFSSHDMHAWPEVYFRGSGWVKFEPTPAVRTGGAPTYTTGVVKKPGSGPSESQTKGGGRNATDTTSAAAPKGQHNQTSDSTASTSHSSVPWVPLVVGLLVLLVVGALCYLPGLARRSRRGRRLAGGAEDAWLELRDSAVDLGVGWPAGRSPQETGYLLSAWFGPEPDGPPLVRPPRGRGLSPGGEDALDRIVLTLERVRYARYADDIPGALADHVTTVVTALEHGSTRANLRRARWFPRSLFGRAGARGAASVEREPEAVNAGGVIDHVG
jgi:transglutaminase-like putative cysteine protease